MIQMPYPGLNVLGNPLELYSIEIQIISLYFSLID